MKLELSVVTECPVCNKKGYFEVEVAEFDDYDITEHVPRFICDSCGFKLVSRVEVAPSRTVFQTK